MNSRTLFKVAFCLAFALMTARAQNLGSIVGLVSDSTGAVVPSAVVKVTQQETGVARTFASDSTGTYLAPTLNAGTYTVEVSAPGFKGFRQTDIVLNVRDQLRVDVRLEVGQVAETIEVVGQAVSLQTETASVEEVVSARQVQSLMMNGRSFLQLPALVPGASSTQPAFNTPVGVTANAGISFNGLRSNHNVWRVDGQENYDRGCGGCVEILPSVDAIAEFKVSTANSDADMGFGAAGQINLTIKSGTRDFHGTLYEFLRNDKFDANQFFRNINGSPKAKLRFNNFGYNFGGPVLLPGYNKERNKTFFFWNQEWRKLRSEAVYFQPAIPAEMRRGDFSSATQTIIDPLTNQPFPNKIIPTSRIDPNAAILSDPNLVFPLPNAPNNRWSGVGAQPINVREEILRVDHNINERNQIFFRFVHDTTNQQFPVTQWGGQTYPTVGTMFTNQPKAYHGQWTSTFTPNVVNEASLSFSRQPLQLNPTGSFQRPAGLKIPELFEGNNANRIPNIRLQGAIGVTIDTNSWPWTNNLDTFILRDNMIWNHGKHTFRIGGEYMPLAKRQDLFGQTQGDFYFNNNGAGHDYANFLLGRSFEYRELQKQTSPTYQARSGSIHINDTWRMSPRLTMNLGIRYDMLPHAFEKDDLMAAFYPGLYDPAKAPAVLADGQLIGGDPLNGIAQAGKNGIPRGITQNHWNTFLPRIGFAWRPWGEDTVIRFGYGLYTERIQGNDVYNVGPNPPNSFTAQIFDAPLSNPGGGSQRRFPSNLQTYDGPYNLPQIHQYNFGIQRRITNGVVLTAGYVGSSAAHLQTTRNINQPSPEGAARVRAGLATVNQVRPYLGWGNIMSFDNSTGSNYNSFQFGLRTENYKGLTLQASYTWSHALDYTTQDAQTGNQHQDAYNTSLERANSQFDRRQMLILSYVYEIQTPKSWSAPLRHTLGGWTFSGISSFQSGEPLNITLPGDNAYIGGAAYRPDVVRDPNLPGDQRIRERYFDPTAFAQPAPGRFGNAARNNVRRAGINNWDLSLFKNIPLGWESGALQFRGEFFNAFNHTQWTGYRNGFASAGFGEANTARDARTIQLGLKLLF